MSTVVAIVPAKDRADSVGATVQALRDLPQVHHVLVVDDGSADGTAAAASAAGATVLRLAANVGKGDAVLAGVRAEPDAEVFLLIDADLADTAGVAGVLLAPVLAGDADLAIAVLPPAAGRGGFGAVKKLAARGIERASGQRTMAPLSGQRAVRASLLRDLTEAHRFGFEVALTIDAKRAGARIVEVEAPMEHRHTGRGLGGFAHRGRQGLDILGALWPRVTSARQRITALLVGGVVVLGLLVGLGGSYAHTGVEPTARPSKVLIFGVPRLGLDDLQQGRMPTLSRLAGTGAVSVNSTHGRSSLPSPVESYATIGAGVRVTPPPDAADARMADETVEGSTAAEVVSRRTGKPAKGQVVVVGGPQTIATSGGDLGSAPGTLGTALDHAGKKVAVVNNGDTINGFGGQVVSRPAAVAMMNDAASVDLGDVRGDVGDGSLLGTLLLRDPAAPFGIRANPDGVVSKAKDALAKADVVLVDPGDTDRAGQYAPLTSGNAAEALRRTALRHTDQILARLVKDLPKGTLLLVVSMTPPQDGFALTPMVAYGTGVRHGYVFSPSTRRTGLTTLTDIGPTVLHDLGVKQPAGMIGAPLIYQPGSGDLEPLKSLDASATAREDTYGPNTTTFLLIQAVGYLLLLVLVLQGRTSGRFVRLLRFATLAFLAWPLATFLVRFLPSAIGEGLPAEVTLWVIAVLVAWLADRRRTSVLAPVIRICGITVAVVLADLATGARGQELSMLGYSPHAGARYTGIGNMAFGAFAAAAALYAILRIARVPVDRKREALLVAAIVFGLVIVADGWPTLGSDFGGVVTMAPVFGVAWLVASGRRIRWRTVVWIGAATLLLVGGAAGLDLLRPADQRTHLGRFVASLFDGSGEAWTTITRKVNTNVVVLQNTDWSTMVPIIGIFAYGILVVRNGWDHLVPRGSMARIALVAVVAVSVLGALVNDSGVVVTALALVYVGPLLAVLVLDPPDPEPELIPADVAVADPASSLPAAAQA